MSVTINSPFKAPPSISEAGFVRILESHGSFQSDALWNPTPRGIGSQRLDEARRIYRLIASRGHDPAIWLAILGKESSFGTNRSSVLWRNNTRSWTNARSVRDPSLNNWQIITDRERKSEYVRYASAFDSVQDGIYRVDDPSYAYRDARTILEVISIWAPGSDGNAPRAYAQTMVDWINDWQQRYPVESEQPTMPYPFIRGLIDIRHELAREPSHGPNQKRSLAEKRGVVVHYAGDDQPIDRYTDKQLIRSYADYHAHDAVFGYDHQGRGFHADGLQYHISIGRNGEKYLCRDLESVLWHCGAWPQNGTALAINLPIGGNQRATPAQLTALQEVCDDWFAAGHGDRRWETWGHQELSYTGCPGTLMFDFVLPYREGTIVTVQDESLDFPNGKRIIGGFYQFWKSNNGLVTLGPPETNEVDLDDPTSPAVPNNPLPGKRRVQRFQKSILVWLPELPAGFQVQVLSINEPLFDQARAA